jgi:DNA-binding PucR family transcriptional regulator
MSKQQLNPQTIQAALNRLADTIDPRALGNHIGDLVVRDIRELARRADDDLRQAARAAARRSLADVWEGVRAERESVEIVSPPEGIAFARELVHRRADVSALLRAYRLGHALVEDAWSEAAIELGLDPAVAQLALLKASRYFFGYVDAVSLRLTDAYNEERLRWARSSAAVRAEMLHRLLDRERVPASRASTALRYDVNPVHTGFVLWADPDRPNATSSVDLEQLAGSIVEGLGGGASMVVSIGDWVVWGWVTVAESSRSRKCCLTLPDVVQVAVGNPAAGIEGFVRTHEEAMAARRVAGLFGRRSAAIVKYRSVALMALLSTDAGSATRFVESELGELAAPTDPMMARLREALRVYFDENASPSHTARRLNVNKNTVVYRVAKAEELLGHDLADRRPELEAALRLADVADALREASAQSERGTVPVGSSDQTSPR